MADVIDRQSIIDKVEELKKQREEFVAQANAQVSAMNGAIQVLEQLLAKKDDEDDG